jgi:hypothetical protein
MGQFLEKRIFVEIAKKLLRFVEPCGSVPCLPQRATGAILSKMNLFYTRTHARTHIAPMPFFKGAFSFCLPTYA